MKLNVTNPAFIACLLLLSFSSCQKEAHQQGTVSTGVANNGVHDLPVDSSLVLWLPFTKGSLKDKSGKGNNVVFSSAKLTLGKHGTDSNAYNFNGSSSYMQILNSPSLNPVGSITLAALIQPNGFYDGACHGNYIISKQYSDNGAGRYVLGFTDARYYNYNGCNEPVKRSRENFFGVYGNGTTSAGVTDTDYIKKGQWYDLVYTYDGAISKLYINDKLAMTDTATTDTFKKNPKDVILGKTVNPNFPFYFKGVIDEVRIYNRALSADEVIGLDKEMGKSD